MTKTPTELLQTGLGDIAIDMLVRSRGLIAALERCGPDPALVAALDIANDSANFASSVLERLTMLLNGEAVKLEDAAELRKLWNDDGTWHRISGDEKP